jgi:hypothetical protein
MPVTDLTAPWIQTVFLQYHSEAEGRRISIFSSILTQLYEPISKKLQLPSPRVAICDYITSCSKLYRP